MSTPPKPVMDVRTIRSTSNRAVLVLEGKEDSEVYSRWLKKLMGPGSVVSGRLNLVAVGGKINVLTALEWYRDHEGNPDNIFGIVDRDEWDDATIATKKGDLSQLRVNTMRHGIESYFCDPSEIEPALLAEDTSTYGPLIAAFNTQAATALEARVDHWCLFTVTERVKQRMIEVEYPGIFHDLFELPDDTEILSRLRTWSSILDSDRIFDEFTRLRSDARSRTSSDRFRGCVWAKPFFEGVVCSGAAGLQQMKAKNTTTWMIDLAEHSPTVPADIEAILRELIL